MVHIYIYPDELWEPSRWKLKSGLLWSLSACQQLVNEEYAVHATNYSVYGPPWLSSSSPNRLNLKVKLIKLYVGLLLI